MIRTALGPLLALALVLTACAAPSGGPAPADAPAEASGEPLTIDGTEALTWGDGAYGVVLAHGAAFDAASWGAQAVRIAEQDATVVAVEDISPDAIAAALAHLQGNGVADVALVGGSAGADAILQLAAEQPALADQLILLSPNSIQDGLGTQPKLFVASEDEPLVGVARELADTAPGEDNEDLVVPGSAHAQNIFDSDQGETVTLAVLERLAEFADR